MNALQLTKELVGFESPSFVSNKEVSHFIAELLRQMSFDIEFVNYFDSNGVEKVNVLGRKGPTSSTNGGLAYFCHSDVVPVEVWDGAGQPFQATEHQGRLYGRGSCDMKGSAACMLTAMANLDDSVLSAPLYFVCTADEELSYRGAHQLVQHSQLYREMVAQQTRALIGEPTELEVVYAHKGICKVVVQSLGEAAHSSSRAGRNANLAMIPFLQTAKTVYDETETQAEWLNEEFDPPGMSLNIGINDHTTAINVKPAVSTCTLFYRPLPRIDDAPLLERIAAAAEQHGLKYTLHERIDSVYTEPDDPFVKEALEICQLRQAKTVAYGTDAGELTELQHKIVCGPGSIAQAHTTDEWIDLKQLELGTDVYERFLRRWCL